MRRMILFSLTIVSMVLGTSIVSQAQSGRFMTHHMRDVTSNGQAPFVGRLPAVATMQLDIVLPLRNQADLDTFLQEVYDPASPLYRQFLTVQEFTQRFGPTQEDYDAVVNFAKANGFAVVGGSRDGMDVQIVGSVSAVESAFHVNIGLYRHPTENRNFFAPDREPTANLPIELWHISGLDNFSIPQPLYHHRDFTVQSNATSGSVSFTSFSAVTCGQPITGKALSPELARTSAC